jgi:hypothetical protein
MIEELVIAVLRRILKSSLLNQGTLSWWELCLNVSQFVRQTITSRQYALLMKGSGVGNDLLPGRHLLHPLVLMLIVETWSFRFAGMSTSILVISNWVIYLRVSYCNCWGAGHQGRRCFALALAVCLRANLDSAVESADRCSNGSKQE